MDCWNKNTYFCLKHFFYKIFSFESYKWKLFHNFEKNFLTNKLCLLIEIIWNFRKFTALISQNFSKEYHSFENLPNYQFSFAYLNEYSFCTCIIQNNYFVVLYVLYLFDSSVRREKSSRNQPITTKLFSFPNNYFQLLFMKMLIKWAYSQFICFHHINNYYCKK